MKIKYYIGDIEFCECEEGSTMDLAIRHIQAKERARVNDHLQKLIFGSKPIEIPKRKESRNILEHLRR